MKGFIEITSGGRRQLINVNSIIRICSTSNLIVINELIQVGDSEIVSVALTVEETYEEIKELIKETTEL